MLNPVHLHTLVAVLRTGSFADAARELGYTGSAVSQQIAALERAVRVPLFERSAHSVTPTPAAQLIAERALEVLAGLGALEADVAALAGGDAGRVRVGSFPTASKRLVPGWLARHHATRPGIEVALDEDEPPGLMQRLVSGEIDIALMYRYDHVPHPWPGGLRRVPVHDEGLLLLLPEAHSLLAGDAPVDLADLAGEQWVATREGTDGARCVQHLCAERGFDPAVRYRSNDYGVVRELVALGLGVAAVPSLGWEATEGVVACRIDGLAAQRHIVAVHRSPVRHPAVDAVLQDLRAVSTCPQPVLDRRSRCAPRPAGHGDAACGTTDVGDGRAQASSSAASTVSAAAASCTPSPTEK